MNNLRAITAAFAAQLAKRTEDVFATSGALHVAQQGPIVIGQPSGTAGYTEVGPPVLQNTLVAPFARRVYRIEYGAISNFAGVPHWVQMFNLPAVPAQGTVPKQLLNGGNPLQLAGSLTVEGNYVCDWASVGGYVLTAGLVLAFSTTQLTLTSNVGSMFQARVWWTL